MSELSVVYEKVVRYILALCIVSMYVPVLETRLFDFFKVDDFFGIASYIRTDSVLLILPKYIVGTVVESWL